MSHDPATAAALEPDPPLDAVIVGGGVAGLWLLNLLHARGYRVRLLEADRLGGVQTLASQGMIHGGLKYALAGALTGASEAIARMPARWRACLEGAGEVDLAAVEPLSDRYYLFAEASTLGQLTGFFASRALRGRIRRLRRAEYPPAFADPGFNGVVYELNDFVLDIPALLRALLAPVSELAFRHRLEGRQVRRDERGVTLELGAETWRARHLVFSAGAGTEALLRELDIDSPRMQRRPLQQVIVRHRHPHPLYAHCVTGIRRPEPRLTITSHRHGEGWLWYLGGQLASDGAEMLPDRLIRTAQHELRACVPWLDWRGAEFTTLRVDRAEPAQSGGQRPDQAFAAASGRCIVAWPTKLSLAPDLGDRVLALLGQPHLARADGPVPTPSRLPLAHLGASPWGA